MFNWFKKTAVAVKGRQSQMLPLFRAVIRPPRPQ